MTHMAVTEVEGEIEVGLRPHENPVEVVGVGETRACIGELTSLVCVSAGWCRRRYGKVDEKQ